MPPLCPRCRRAGAGRWGEFVGQRYDALADDDAGQRHLRGPADRRRQSPAARDDSADRVQPGGRTGDAVRVLRLRLQRRNDVGRPHAAQPLRRVRTRCGHQLRDDPVRRRRHRRADQCDPDRRIPRRSPPSSPTWCSSARSGRTGPSSTTTPSRRWRRRWDRWSARSRPAKPGTGATAFVLCRQLRQRLLGSGAGHRSRRQARPGAGAQTGCSAGALGRQRLHLQLGDRELAAGQHLQGDVRR